MCGRLVLTSNYREKIKAIFANIVDGTWLPPRYNITPGQTIPALINPAATSLSWLRWGISPSRPKQPPLINARSETAHQLSTFREAFAKRRCIQFADGFYEWKRVIPTRPQPYYFHHADDCLLLLAGLWEPGEPPTCVVLTTEANTLMQPVHNRMPVLLDPESARLWLQPETHPETLKAILQPCPSRDLRCHPVSERVNRANNEGADLIAPVKIFEQGALF